ncbi:hypothetical protein N7G274_002362 [Stereocaulon virgatum]|uniref:Uncharacterized protein n=1 Tax=Stereocaulon virgatum TaxID=373712 RepID=A0ABR4AIH0_9LECA
MAEKPAEKSPWLKKVLIPFWVAQFIVMIALLSFVCLMGIYAIRPTQLVIIILCINCVFLDIMEITLLAIHSLAPIAYLIFQCVKTIIWFTVLAITILTANQQRRGAEWTASGFLVFRNGLVEAVVLGIIHIGTLIYASVTYHRHRQASARKSRNSLEQHRYDRSRNGPYGQDGIGKASSQTLSSPSDQYTCGGRSSRSLVECGCGEAEGKPMLSLGWTQELQGEGEAHELATTKSVRSLKSGGGTVEALNTLK